MEKWDIRAPLPQKPLNRSSPKFALVLTSGIPTLCKISSRYHYSLWQAKYAKMRIKWLGWFFGSFFSLQPRLLHRFLRSIRQMTSFHAMMCLLGAPKTKNFTFRVHFPTKRKILVNFWWDSRFRIKKAWCSSVNYLNRYRSPMKVV